MNWVWFGRYSSVSKSSSSLNSEEFSLSTSFIAFAPIYWRFYSAQLKQMMSLILKAATQRRFRFSKAAFEQIIVSTCPRVFIVRRLVNMMLAGTKFMSQRTKQAWKQTTASMQICDKYGKFIIKPDITSNMMRTLSKLELGQMLMYIDANFPSEVFFRAKSSKRTKTQGKRQKMMEKIQKERRALNWTPSGLKITFFCIRLLLSLA